MIDYQSNADVRVLPDGPAIAKLCAQRLVEIAAAAVKEKGSFDVALAGGSTPKILYNLLVERSASPFASSLGKNARLLRRRAPCKAPDHPDSNYRMAFESLISRSPLKPEQVTRMKGEYPEAEDAAKEYDQHLRTYYKLAEGQFPRFDLVLLGMGSEGHTLSIFPGTKALRENRRIAVHNWVGKVLMDRITLTAAAVNNAANVIFMVAGADKAPALTAVLEHFYEPDQLPAQLIQPTKGSLLWLVDTAAGSMLTRAIRE